MATMMQNKNRRVNDKIIFIERRKGKFYMYSQLTLSMMLFLWLFWLIK